MNTSDIDDQVMSAFDELVRKASSSHLLGEIAMQPNGRHETTVSSMFRDALDTKLSGEMNVLSEKPILGYRPDITVKINTEIVSVIEIKTPFTNHDGIKNKTRRNSDYLPKDMNVLKVALVNGVAAVYELVTPIGCYPVDVNGNMIVHHNAIKKNEDSIKVEYDIHWPTRPDYESNPKHGKPEVDLAMRELADDRGLKMKRIKGWRRIELPNPKPNFRAFLDCALYKVQLK